jgi:mono/diheme cytochrome c family protein
MRRSMGVIGAVAGLLVSSVVAALLYALLAYDRSWDVPIPDVRASSDSALIARGEYLVYGPGHCADCHSQPSERERLFAGEIVPLTGGIEEDTWLGRWMAPNLTSDTVTGIGALSDGQIARMMRHGVNRDDQISLPFTDSFADLTEEDLVAILSYLRTLPPEDGVGPASEAASSSRRRAPPRSGDCLVGLGMGNRYLTVGICQATRRERVTRGCGPAPGPARHRCR